jgi:small subunit ribosomal protein S16
MLCIKLSRVGKKKQPTFRVIITEKSRDPWGLHKEIVGNVNLRGTQKVYALNKERIAYWLSVGAQPTATMHNILVAQGLIKDAKKQKAVRLSTKRKAKLEKKKAAAA